MHELVETVFGNPKIVAAVTLAGMFVNAVLGMWRIDAINKHLEPEQRWKYFQWWMLWHEVVLYRQYRRFYPRSHFHFWVYLLDLFLLPFAYVFFAGIYSR